MQQPECKLQEVEVPHFTTLSNIANIENDRHQQSVAKLTIDAAVLMPEYSDNCLQDIILWIAKKLPLDYAELLERYQQGQAQNFINWNIIATLFNAIPGNQKFKQYLKDPFYMMALETIFKYEDPALTNLLVNLFLKNSTVKDFFLESMSSDGTYHTSQNYPTFVRLLQKQYSLSEADLNSVLNSLLTKVVAVERTCCSECIIQYSGMLIATLIKLGANPDFQVGTKRGGSGTYKKEHFLSMIVPEKVGGAYSTRGLDDDDCGQKGINMTIKIIEACADRNCSPELYANTIKLAGGWPDLKKACEGAISKVNLTQGKAIYEQLCTEHVDIASLAKNDTKKAVLTYLKTLNFAEDETQSTFDRAKEKLTIFFNLNAKLGSFALFDGKESALLREYLNFEKTHFNKPHLQQLSSFPPDLEAAAASSASPSN